MAARSTHVTLENKAQFLNLRRTDMGIEHGVFADQPPLLIGDRGEWTSESNGFLTGTEGRVTYQIENTDGQRLGEVRLHWNNPFVGSNSYDESVSPASTSPTDNGFSVIHLGGSGDDARVKFMLLSGFCHANQETGEFFCASAEQLTNAADRYAAVFEQSPGTSFHAVHGLSSNRYQQTFDQLVARGFRPAVVSGYSVGGQDHFAAVFELRGGPPFQARHGLTAAQYQQTFDALVPQGFRPVVLSGYSSGGQDRYAVVFEQRNGPTFQARHGLTAAQYQQTFDQLVAQGFRPVVLSGYSVGGQDRFAAVFEQSGGPPFQARHGLTAAQYQQTFDELLPQGFRPVIVSGYSSGGQDRYAAVFEQRGGPIFQARHGLTSPQYQQTFDQLVPQGFRPVVVSGYSVG